MRNSDFAVHLVNVAKVERQGWGMADVFISYKREERAKVEAIAERLRGVGLSVWFDSRLAAGESFDEEINREVRAARCVLVCWSPGAVESQWVRAEAGIGRERDVLCAIMLEEAQLMPPYNVIHTADLTKWNGEDTNHGWLAALARIGQLTERPDLVARGERHLLAGGGARASRKKRGAGFWLAIAASAIVLGVAGLFAAQRLFSPPAPALYDVAFKERVIGLRDGAAVFFNGVEVGLVRRVYIDAEDSSRVVARLELSPNTPIRDDSVATLETVGAQLAINISPGSAGAGLLRSMEGQRPPRIPLEAAVFREGSFLLGEGAPFDLDEGVVPQTPGEGVVDLVNQVGQLVLQAQFLHVTPTGASGALPSYAQCVSAFRNGVEEPAANATPAALSDGAYACIRTDKNRMGAISGATNNPENAVSLRYVVWQER